MNPSDSQWNEMLSQSGFGENERKTAQKSAISSAMGAALNNPDGQAAVEHMRDVSSAIDDNSSRNFTRLGYDLSEIKEGGMMGPHVIHHHGDFHAAWDGGESFWVFHNAHPTTPIAVNNLIPKATSDARKAIALAKPGSFHDKVAGRIKPTHQRFFEAFINEHGDTLRQAAGE
jgi:hypothetical protein